MQTFPLVVDGIGTFQFRDRTFRDQVRIEAMASETLGRHPSQLRPDEEPLGRIAMAHAMISTLVAESPAGWNVETLDPLADDDAMQLLQVYRGLTEQLARFRDGRKQAGAAARA